MRRAVTCLLVGIALCAPAAAAERRSWHRIRYVGGTIPIKTSPYDYDTKLTISTGPDSIVIVIAPAKVFSSEQTVSIKPSQVVSLSVGTAARQRVSDVQGSQVPNRQPSLFGYMQDS